MTIDEYNRLPDASLVERPRELFFETVDERDMRTGNTIRYHRAQLWIREEIAHATEEAMDAHILIPGAILAEYSPEMLAGFLKDVIAGVAERARKC